MGQEGRACAAVRRVGIIERTGEQLAHGLVQNRLPPFECEPQCSLHRMSSIAPRLLLVIAHRGSTSAILENTLRGIGRALAVGVDAIEVDVRLSADGVPVLLHDPTLDRTTDGRGPVSAQPVAALRRLAAGGDEPVPTLAEALTTIGNRTDLIIELKGGGPGGIRLADRVVTEVRRQDRSRDVWLWSFDSDILARLDIVARDLRIVHLCYEPNAEVVNRSRALRLAGIAMQYEHASPPTVAALHDEGFATFVWTVNDPVDLARLVRLPLMGIVSDDPERVRTAIRSRR